MKQKVLLGGLVLAVCLGGIFMLTRGGTITNYPPKNSTIVAFGDSLVFGKGATEGNDFVSQLEVLLGRNILNLGVSGDTTHDGVARMNEVLKHDPGIVILLLGGNDALRRVPKEETRANLARLIETFQQNKSVVVLLGVRGGIIIDGREEMYRELSEVYGTLYVEDVLDGIFRTPELMSDGIHPNDAGYAIIAERLQRLFIDEQL